MNELIPFPKDFLTRVSNDLFIPDNLIESLNSNSPISVRFNPLKVKSIELDVLNGVAWCENGFYLKERPVYTLDPLFHAGAYYPQEAGSMFITKVLQSLKTLELPANPVVLDLCAAPGGKSTLVSSFLGEKGLLISNEPVMNRARILQENMVKWGATNSLVVNAKPIDFQKLPFLFDLILIDAPCSGEGMFRKDPNARSEWSLANAENCVVRQTEIIEDIWSKLSPNGYLIYSTCTFNPKENEKMIESVLKQFSAELVQIDQPENSKLGRNNLGTYFFPGTTETEGFYIAVIQKKELLSDAPTFEKKAEKSIKKSGGKSKFGSKDNSGHKSTRFKDEVFLEKFGLVKDGISFLEWEQKIFAIPNEFEDEILATQANLHILKMGTEIGERIHQKFIPKHDLALTKTFENLNFSKIELSKEEALHFLKGEPIHKSGEKGWTIATYLGEHLGWLNNLGNRSNNGYPKEWRIRMKL